MLESADWLQSHYPDLPLRALVFEFVDGNHARLPVPGNREKFSPLEEAILAYLPGKRRMSAVEVRDGLEKAGKCYGLSSVERALTALRKRNLITRGRDEAGVGFGV